MNHFELPLVSAHHPSVRAALLARKGDGPPLHVLVEGTWAHAFMLSHNTAITTFLWCPEASGQTPELAREVASRAAEAFRISERTLARISRRTRSDGLVSLVRLPAYEPAEFPVSERTVLLIADGVQYAGNLGTLLRIVDASGAHGLLLVGRRVRREHPMVFTASRGSLLTTPTLEFSTAKAAIDWLDAHNVTRYLADPQASRDFRSYEKDPRKPLALVVGSEGHGLSQEWFDHPHVATSIPMRGTADSLNVAVAAGILLYGLSGQLDP